MIKRFCDLCNHFISGDDRATERIEIVDYRREYPNTHKINLDLCNGCYQNFKKVYIPKETEDATTTP